MSKYKRGAAVVAFLFIVAAIWGYASVYRLSVGSAVARQTALRWLGPAHQFITSGEWRTTMVGYGGYIHRDWEIQELVCIPGPTACQSSYAYTIYINGQTGHVDRALIDIGPGVAGWPLTVVRHPSVRKGGA